MINIERYNLDFEDEYWEIVKQRIPVVTQRLLQNSCRKFLPKDFFANGDAWFEELIKAPYDKLKRAEKYIREQKEREHRQECFDQRSKNKSHINDTYFAVYQAFEGVANATRNGESTRVRMVKAAGITVCPYCNRDYINCRARNVSGAQLDHFFSRSRYPLFAVCLYNLVPVCGNCNRVKSASDAEGASPFDESIDWMKEVTFVYTPKSLNGLVIDIETKNEMIQNNLKTMRIKEAYQIHDREIKELLSKKKAYSRSQIKEIQDIMKKVKITDEEIKQVIFGPEITPRDIRNRPLGKMMRDMHKEWGIY